MRKLTGIMIAALLMIGSIVKAQQVNQLSAKQAVEYGLKNAVQVKNALLDILVQQQTNKDITAAAYPSIKATGAFNDYLNIPTSLLPGEFFGAPAGTFIPVKFGTKYSATGGISLNQTIFDGQVFVGLQARKTSIDLRVKAAEVTEENIKANIYKIYYQLVVSKTQIELLNANISRLEKLSHDTKEIYKNGFAEKVDVDKLTVQIANLETEKLKALNSIANGYAGLKVLMGMPMKDSLQLTDTLSENELKENILESSNYQYSDRKEYQLAELTSKLNGFNIKRYQLSQIPTLSFNANYSKQAQRTQFDFFKRSGDWFTTSFIGFNLTIPIFNGFSARAKIAGARLALQQSQNQLEAQKISIDNDVTAAKNNFITAIATIDYQKKNMALAETVYEQTKKKYEVGTGSTTEINTAQVDLKTAQTNYISALYDAIIARIDFLKATGKLN
ncbi:TolC family protein [Ferruginibacter paludis]|uniref:TolC family protein n=1 Tax=Ferruginibacter paludis TaxID=1310417 RepID=UPI0025B2EF5F|nr:TolC family protein [Ferruginibacter paludis]MDN3659072.1 TolC family protein [Ferruginibacter paludis]